MSGQPYRYASDVENYRAEYMSSLGLRVNIDDMNYQANKNYLETGVLPARSQMKDKRATADILLDTEKLKLGIIKDFKPVAGPNMAMAIIQRVIASPLNGDGSFFIWLAQNTPELVMQLKKKYKLGIAGDENDVATMVLFLQSLYSKTKDMNASVKSTFDRPVNTGGTSLNPKDYTEIRDAFNDVYLKLIGTRPLTPKLQQIKDRLDAMRDIFIPLARYNDVKQAFLNIGTLVVNNPAIMTNAVSRGFKQSVDYNENLPSATEVRAVISQLKKSELNADATLSIQILTNLLSLLPTVQDSRNYLNASALILQAVQTPIGPVPTPLAQAALATAPAVPQPAAGTPQANGPLIAETILTFIYNMYEDKMAAGTTSATFNFSTDIIDALDSMFPFVNNYNINYTKPNIKRAIELYTQNSLNTVGQLINNDDLQTYVARDRAAIEGFMRQSGMVGFGLKRRGRPKGSGLVKPITERIDKTKGIKQGCTQIPFGKYIINKNKLDNDIFYILDAKKGYCVKGYPQKKISSELSSVVKSIIGGSVPKFEDLQNLDNDDKEYLHKVASKAGVLDKLSIPAPSKDKTEKDIHQFEVMKGEILAGNDSNELIKKFKLLLLRLSKNGSIPKRETVEIMEDLISLGY